jgi:hypothetical protein
MEPFFGACVRVLDVIVEEIREMGAIEHLIQIWDEEYDRLVAEQASA